MKSTCLSLFLTCLFCTTSFGQTEEIIVYDYATVIAQFKKITISHSDGTTEERKRTKNSDDFSEVLAIVAGFEEKGYQLVTNEFDAYEGSANTWKNYFLMRKRKN